MACIALIFQCTAGAALRSFSTIHGNPDSGKLRYFAWYSWYI